MFKVQKEHSDDCACCRDSGKQTGKVVDRYGRGDNPGESGRQRNGQMKIVRSAGEESRKIMRRSRKGSSGPERENPARSP